MPSSEPIAYKMGQTNRQIKVKFDGNCQTMNLVVSATVTSGTGIGEIVNYSIPNYQKQSEVTITLNGSLPAYVTKNNFNWEWTIQVYPLDGMYDPATCTFYTYHTYYVLMSDPVSPCSEPWVEILDYACEWANGANNGNNVCDNLIIGFQNNYKYNGRNCGYFSSDYVRLAASLGVSSSIVKWASKYEQPKNGNMFCQTSKPIRTVGHGDTLFVYNWGYHQWVTNGGYVQRDPSAGISFSGGWGQYEDDVFESYWRKNPETGANEQVNNQDGQPYDSCEDYRKPTPDNCSIIVGYTVFDWSGPNNIIIQ